MGNLVLVEQNERYSICSTVGIVLEYVFGSGCRFKLI